MTRPLIAPTPLATWNELDAELDRWAAAGRAATFWWRDDDAATATAALERLLGLADGTPVALAVIPAEARAPLARRLPSTRAQGRSLRLAALETITVIQHGWRHANHAPPGDKKAELGPHRPAAERLAELSAGRERLAELFGPLTLPVLAPPWNRIAADLVPLLPAIGIRGLSTIGPRPTAEPAPGLRVANIHVDLVDWAGGHGFIGVPPALGAIVGHLAARRLGRVDGEEPTGLLTHHLVQDAATDAFLRRFVDVVRRHPAARWAAASEIFLPS